MTIPSERSETDAHPRARSSVSERSLGIVIAAPSLGAT